MNEKELKQQENELKERMEILCGMLQMWIHLARIKDEKLTCEAGLAEFLKKLGDVHRQVGRAEETLPMREAMARAMWETAWQRALLAEDTMR